MKKIFLLTMVLSVLSAAAQSNPPPVGAFEYSAGSWIAAATTSVSNPLSYTPPPAALYCLNGSNQWVPADSSCFGGGGGSGTVNAGTTGQIAYYPGNGTAVSGSTPLLKSTTDSLYLANSLPTVTGSVIDNVVLGTGGAGSHLAPGASADGGQNNVIEGWGACANATSMRESVCMGSNAGLNITGNGTGLDDMIGVYIGSDACGNLTNLGGAVTCIGQKSLNSATSATGTTAVGIHSAADIAIDSNGNYMGNNILSAGSGFNTTNMSIFGARGLSSAVTGGTLSDDTCVGYNCFSVIDGTGSSTGFNNTGIGSQVGGRLGKGNLNNFFGYQAGSVFSGTISGTRNTLIGDSNTANKLTTGSDNFIADEAAPFLTTGSFNFMWGNPQTGGSVATGSNNIIVGQFAAQNATDRSQTVILGYVAGFSAAADGLTAVGAQAGRLYTGTGGTFVGSHAGLNSGASAGATSGANVTAFGDTNCFSLTTGSNDECFGQAADIAAAVSHAAEIGPGQNTVANTLAFEGKSFVNNSGTITAPLWQPQTIYSAAGTALPTCNSGAKSTMAVVSDATIPTYNGTYTSGGAVTVPVICDGTNWLTH